jgi:hypothetical protein
MSRQFVIQLSHKPGALAALCRELEAKSVDLKAIGGGGIGEHGHVILKTADDEATRDVLTAGKYEFIEGDSVLAEVDDKPGGMLSVLDRLAAAGVNVYGHLFTGRWGDRATFSFVVDDPAKARAALDQKG